jgi:hypothetical protein
VLQEEGVTNSDLESREKNSEIITDILTGGNPTGKKNYELFPKDVLKNKGDYLLPCVGKTHKGFVILGLKCPTEDPCIDDEASITITNRLKLETPLNEEKVCINQALHIGKGVGRTNFGSELKADATPSEQARVWGYDRPINMANVQRQLTLIQKELSYPIKINPIPEETKLAFFTKDMEVQDNIKRILRSIEEEKFKKGAKTEDGESIKRKMPPILPNLRSNRVTIAVLATEKTGQKEKIICTDVFPSIPLYYWWHLQNEFSENNVDIKLTGYGRVVKNGPHASASPAAYTFWTKTLTDLLNKTNPSMLPYWRALPTFLKQWGNTNLAGDGPKGAKNYEKNQGAHFLTLCRILNRLNALVDLETLRELTGKENSEIQPYLTMKEKTNTLEQAEYLAKERLGELYDALSPSSKKKVVYCIQLTESSIPEKERENFALGVAFGATLNLATYLLNNKANRRYQPGDGKHFTNLRGESLHKTIEHAWSLTENYNKGVSPDKKIKTLPQNFLVHSLSNLKASRTDEFNAGLLSGYSLYLPSEETSSEEPTEVATTKE